MHFNKGDISSGMMQNAIRRAFPSHRIFDAIVIETKSLFTFGQCLMV
jgi:hypothetical protein